MFVEGIIDKEYFDMIAEAGYDIVWVCKSTKDAKEHDYDLSYTELKEKGQVLIRIFLDMDIEDVITPQAIAREDKKLLGIMAVSENKLLKDYAIKQLRGKTNGLLHKST